jgi:hypothetical protein
LTSQESLKECGVVRCRVAWWRRGRKRVRRDEESKEGGGEGGGRRRVRREGWVEVRGMK